MNARKWEASCGRKIGLKVGTQGPDVCVTARARIWLPACYRAILMLFAVPINCVAFAIDSASDSDSAYGSVKIEHLNNV